MNFPRFI